MFTFDENIFDTKEDILVNFVSCSRILDEEIKRRYPMVYNRYMVACDLYGRGHLGSIQIVAVKDRLVCNVYALELNEDDSLEFDYSALSDALCRLNWYCMEEKYSIAIPCTTDGEEWSIVSSIIASELRGNKYKIYK